MPTWPATRSPSGSRLTPSPARDDALELELALDDELSEGVGEGVALGVVLSDGLGVAVSEGLGVALSEGLGVALSVGLGVAEDVGVLELLASWEVVGVGDALSVGVDVGEGVGGELCAGVGVGEPVVPVPAPAPPVESAPVVLVPPVPLAPPRTRGPLLLGPYVRSLLDCPDPPELDPAEVPEPALETTRCGSLTASRLALWLVNAPAANAAPTVPTTSTAARLAAVVGVPAEEMPWLVRVIHRPGPDSGGTGAVAVAAPA
jgi:hypothetical protein